MNSTRLQPNKANKKRSQWDPDDSPDFFCGACSKIYKSYPALHLHIKRKHDGLRPPGTKIQKRSRIPLNFEGKTGRPQKVNFSAFSRYAHYEIV